MKSRYGDKRIVTDNGHGMWTISGKALYSRAGGDNNKIEFFDPEGGPFIGLGDNLGFGKITEIIVEKAPTDEFKIRVQTETA